MDEGQNNANQANGNSAGSQGIFSTPELTVDTTKISQPNTTNDKSRVASVFANTDAGQRSQKLNNAMGVSSQPITEDLVIRNEPKKRSKAPIVVAILVLAAAVGGLVGWLVVSNMQRTPQETVVSVEDAKKKFDQYATYLLYGESKDELSGQYDIDATYELNEQVSDLEEYDAAYWTESIKLLQNAISTYEQVTEKEVALLELMQGNLEQLKFLQAFGATGDLNEDDLFEYLLKTDAESAQTYIPNKYSTVQTLNSDTSKMYMEAVQNYFNLLLENIEMYNTLGCTVDGSIREDCMSDLTPEQTEQLRELRIRVAQGKNVVDDIVESLVRQLEFSCWQINTRFLNSKEGE